MVIRTTIHEIFEERNVQEAIDFLMAKPDSTGSDGMNLHSIRQYWADNSAEVLSSLREASFSPSLATQYERIQKNGKIRTITTMPLIAFY